MLLLSLLNFLSGNLRQAVANPIGKRSVIKSGCTFPQRTLFLVVHDWVVRFADSLFCHEKMLTTLNQYCIIAYVVRTICVTRMTAFIAGCPTSEIPGSPDFTRPSICDYLERVFSWGAE